MRRRTVITYAAAAGVAACVRTPEQPPLRFDTLQPIRLLVASFATEENMQPVRMDFIDRRRSDELVGTTREYLSARYVAAGAAAVGSAGGTDSGVGIIEEATLIERPRTGSGVFSKINPVGPGTELSGSLAVRIVIRGADNTERAFARARQATYQPIPNGSSILERDRLAKALARDLVIAIDKALSQSVRENLGPYLATA